jgi:multiple sugar transport system permease protein
MNARTLPYLLLLPALLFLLAFFLYPFLLVAWQAFFTEQNEFTTRFVSKMVKHWKFDKALTNTFLLVLAVVPIQLALSLLMATMVSKMQRGRDTVLYIWTIPLGISDLAAGLIWLAIFEQTGFLNSALHAMGFIDQPVTFLGYQNKTMIFVAVMIAEVWRATAIMLVILVAGIGLIPKEYYEAAEVFGASRWKQFTRITFPLLKPSLQTALILRVILAFEVFAVVIALSGTNLPVLMSEVYRWQFELQDNHIAASFAMLILLISVAFTLLFMWILRTPREAQV